VVFDERGRVIQIDQPGKGDSVYRTTYTFADDGRLLKVEYGTAGAPPDAAHTEEAQHLDDVDLSRFHGMTGEDREKMLSLLAVVASGMRTEYHYDATGRVASRTRRMGMLREDHTTCTYDEHGNPVEESHRSVSREIGLADGDRLAPGEEKVRTQQNRFTYTYDAHGNCTERVASWRNHEGEDYRASNIERRVLEYFL
jgi:YD repeat-containing protein